MTYETSAGAAPRIAQTRIVALYEPTDGRVVHLHHVVMYEGGRRVDREEVEREALEKAAERGTDTSRLGVHHLDGPPPEGRGVLRFDTSAGRLVVEPPPDE